MPTGGSTRSTVGSGDHEVRQGECVSSIAAEAGHFWETIWNEPANGELRRVRGNPNSLLPGDRLTVPPIRDKSASGGTGQRHRFRRKGVPTKLALQVFDEGEPRADQAYHLDVEGQLFEGTTDGTGKLEQIIPCGARTATLRVGDDEFELALGELDPITEISGIQGRLNNLGYDCGPIDGKLGPETRKGLSSFQDANGIEATGEPDDATRDALTELHGL